MIVHPLMDAKQATRADQFAGPTAEMVKRWATKMAHTMPRLLTGRLGAPA